MCGLAGIVSNSPIDGRYIQVMIDAVSHRGPDDEGTQRFLDGRLWFGHRRLAILDLSLAGHQPMPDGDDRFWIIYNGEIYNYLELRKQLELSGHTFTSNTDTAVILAAYEQWGIGCLDHFNGMWAFAIYDRYRQMLFCSRDRFGVKPFYYTQINDMFVFASEIKQFLSLPGWKARLNKQRAFEFLVYGGILDHTDKTLFSGVNQLRGGHYLVYDLQKHSYTVDKWYDIRSKLKQGAKDLELAKEEFRIILTDSIRLRLRADVTIGSCLSGGLDSSSIVCIANGLLRQNSNFSQETVSSCFDIQAYDEQKYIDEVTAHTGITSHKVFPQYKDLFEELDTILWHQDEPFCSTSIFAQWTVFMVARQKGLTVMLDGQGADEQLAGYEHFYGPLFKYLLSKRRLIHLKNEIQAYKTITSSSSKQICKVLGKSFLPGSFIGMVRKILRRPDITRWISPGIDLYDSRNLWNEVSTSIREESFKEIVYKILPALLHYEDRNSMAHSIEARVPFLDYRLVEFVLSLDDTYKIRDGKTKFILREALRGILPDAISDRTDKLGFVTPEEVWIREHVSDFGDKLRETIGLSGGFINDNILTRLYTFASGKQPYDAVIWRFVVFGRWLRLFNVKP